MIVQKTSKDTSQHRPAAVRHIPKSLVEASLAQRHQIGRHERGYAHHSAAADASNHASENHGGLIPGETADEIARSEEDVAHHQSGATTENIRQTAGDGLARSIGEEVCRGQPGQ